MVSEKFTGKILFDSQLIIMIEKNLHNLNPFSVQLVDDFTVLSVNFPTP